MLPFEELKKTTFFIERTETIHEIEKILEHKQAILLRSPSCTGKSILSQLLAHHFKKERKVHLLTFLDWKSEQTINDFWKQKTEKTFEECVNAKEATVIILDEVTIFLSFHEKVQRTYADSRASEFWQTVKSTVELGITNPYLRLIFFATYGEGPARELIPTTPFCFPHSFGPNVLFCTDSEAEALFDAFNKIQRNFSRNIQITEVRPYLKNFTGGHIGLLNRALVVIEERFGTEAKYKQIEEKKIAEYVVSMEFFSYVKSIRSAPNFKLLNAEVLQTKYSH